jgi:DNA-binding transcriptional ArsR family regulator
MNELIKYTIDFLKVLSDQTRLEILNLLKDAPKSSKDLEESLNKKQPSISQQLKILLNSNLITFETIENSNKKKIKYYKLKDKNIFKIISSIQSYVSQINNERFKDLRNMDIFDTLS